MNETFEFVVKCKQHIGALGHHISWRHNTGVKVKDEIKIYLPRIKFSVEYNKNCGKTYSIDDLICHAISHEIMHRVIENIEGRQTTRLFDKIAGRVPDNVFKVYSGMEL